MTEQSGVTIYVTYQGEPNAHFDRAYYVDHHLPLVMQHWAQYGLESVAALFPAVAQAGTLAICECRFRDMVSVDAAFASPEAAEVMADLSHFTDLAAHRSRAMPL